MTNSSPQSDQTNGDAEKSAILEGLDGQISWGALMMNSPNAMIITNTAWDIMWVNTETLELTGYTQEELLGEEIDLICSGRSRENFRALRKTISQGGSWSGKLIHTTKTDDLLISKTQASPITTDELASPEGHTNTNGTSSNNADGAEMTHVEDFDPPTSADLYIISCVDITSEEQEKYELEEDLSRMQEFARTLTHDIRNPINVIEGQITQAKKHGVTDEHLADIEDKLNRMNELIDEGLKLARQGLVIEDPKLLHLHEVAHSSWNNVQTYDAQLALDIDTDSPPQIVAEESYLVEVFENLFRNAIDHVGKDVTVTVGSLGDEPRFYIMDDGPGFDDGAETKLFDPGFTTADTGTGFGLAIVRDIIDAHGWSISGTNREVGSGARFEICVPEKHWR